VGGEAKEEFDLWEGLRADLAAIVDCMRASLIGTGTTSEQLASTVPGRRSKSDGYEGEGASGLGEDEETEAA
jgi:hypothetical protein